MIKVSYNIFFNIVSFVFGGLMGFEKKEENFEFKEPKGVDLDKQVLEQSGFVIKNKPVVQEISFLEELKRKNMKNSSFYYEEVEEEIQNSKEKDGLFQESEVEGFEKFKLLAQNMFSKFSINRKDISQKDLISNKSMVFNNSDSVIDKKSSVAEDFKIVSRDSVKNKMLSELFDAYNRP